MVRFILPISLFLLFCLPAKAGNVIHFCGINKERTCSDWLFVRFPSNKIHYTIDPNMPLKGIVKRGLEDFDSKIESIELVFDGYNKILDSSYTGVYIFYSISRDSYSNDLGITTINQVSTHGIYADILNVSCRINKRAYTKFKSKAKIVSIVVETVQHEFSHAIGIDHNNDPASLMYPAYNTFKGLTQDDINTIDGLYVDENEGATNV